MTTILARKMPNFFAKKAIKNILAAALEASDVALCQAMRIKKEQFFCLILSP